MSDYDNTREDAHNDKTEREQKARDAAIEFHYENWMTAVTKSVEKSHGTFADVSEYVGKDFDFKRAYRPAKSEDVFLKELDNKDFTQRAAQILIDCAKGVFQTHAAKNLLEEMAESYAEFQYESNIKD